MIRAELVRRVAETHRHLAEHDLETALKAMLDAIQEGLRRGGRVEIRGFGVFSISHRNARRGRNPKTGVSVDVPSSKVPRFKLGKNMKARLNDG
jgi:integration host factor subunit beta